MGLAETRPRQPGFRGPHAAPWLSPGAAGRPHACGRPFRVESIHPEAMPQDPPHSRRRGPLAALLALLVTIMGAAHPVAAQVAPAVAAGQAAPDAAFERQVLDVLRRHPEAVFEALQTQLRRLEEQKRQSREGALSELQRNPAAAIGSSPTRGQGQVRLIEFSDFQCPYCAAASTTLRAFLAKNSGKLSLTYKFYPLERIHPEAVPSARAAWAAQQQGKFWPFHDALFAEQERLGEPLYLEIARNLGLDLKRFNADRQSGSSLEAKIGRAHV